MKSLSQLCVTRSSTLKEALSRLEETGLGILIMLRTDGMFERTVTDGDIRRLLLGGNELDTPLSMLPQIKSKVLKKAYTRREALEIMNEAYIDHLPVLDDDGTVLDVASRKDIDQQVLLSTPHMGSAEREYCFDRVAAPMYHHFETVRAPRWMPLNGN